MIAPDLPDATTKTQRGVETCLLWSHNYSMAELGMSLKLLIPHVNGLNFYLLVHSCCLR